MDRDDSISKNGMGAVLAAPMFYPEIVVIVLQTSVAH